VKTAVESEIYGLVAEFGSPAELLQAAREARRRGYKRIDGFSPFPIEGLAEALGMHRSRLPYLVLVGGIAGGLSGYLMQYYASAISYPLNVGGRPLNSWPAFVPVTFELAILGAALTAVIGMLMLNGLPRPYHPLFGIDAFARATQDRFFLSIEAADPSFDRQTSRDFLESLTSYPVVEVPP
jgi:hypothetical protein